MNANTLFTGFFMLAGLFGAAGPAFSQQFPPPSEQVRKIEALVNKAATVVNGKGKAAFDEFRKEGSEWWFGETYLFAYDMNLNVLLVAAFPQNEGKNQTGRTDANGKLYHNEFVKVVQSKGAGWVDYMFPRPGQTQPSRKWSYVKAVNIGGTPGLIGAGFYPDYPDKPIRWLIPLAPGGGAELVGATVAKKLTEALKQPVVIEFRPGGSGAAGSELIAKASPDGYSLLQGQLAWISIYPALHAKPAYDPLRDFAPISRLVFVTQILLVHPSLPVKSVKELVELAKRKPGEILYGAAGYGSGPHLAMEWVKAATGSNMVYAPLESTTAIFSAVITGNIPVYFAAAPGALPRIRSGRLRAIAVGSIERSTDLPDVPTIGESGVPGFNYVIWYGLLAPAKTPKEIIDRLNSELVRILKDPETVGRLASEGAEASPTTPEAFAEYLREDQERWRKVVGSAGIRLK